ncbi:MAG: glycosyltransferase [Patescibacteria group bacterium]
MKIVIASSIYPPDIGGPAQYAHNLFLVWKKEGYQVKVVSYTWERRLPAWIKHFFYLIKIMRWGWNADVILVLDTFLVAVPTMFACVLMRKKYIIRTGGDLLWEWHVERTGNLILLREFYSKVEQGIAKLNLKEKIIFTLTRLALKNAAMVVFSTDWQRQIWREPYQLDLSKTAIVENYYGPKSSELSVVGKNFLVAGRNLKLKNLEILKNLKFDFEIGQWSQEKLREKIKNCYALVVPSISDISPNIVLQAIRHNKPFVLTQENGINHRVGEAGVYIDPLNPEDVREKLEWLSEKNNYNEQVQKVADFNFQHNYSQIAQEFLNLYENS